MKTTRKNFLKGLLSVTAAGAVIGLADKNKEPEPQTEPTVTFSRDPQNNEFVISVDSEGVTNITTKLKGAKTKEFKRKIGEQDAADIQSQRICDERKRWGQIISSRRLNDGISFSA